MQTKTMNLYDRRKAKLAEAQGIVDGVKAEGRDMKQTEAKRVEDLMAEVKEIDGLIEDHERTTAPLKEFEKHFQANGRKTYSEPFDGAKHAKHLATTAAARQPYAFDIPQAQLKTLSTTQARPLQHESGSEPSSLPGASATSLRELFTQDTATSGSVRFYRVGYQGAEIVDEGELKPEGEVTAEAVDGELVKIATTFRVTDELTEDAPQLFQAVTGQAAREVLKRENRYIVDTLLADDGVPLVETDAENIIDAVADAIAARATDTGLELSALVLSPTDYAILRKARSGNGVHLVDPFAEAPNTLHGLQLFPSSALEAGTAFALAPGAGTFWSRGPVRIETGFTGDDFVRNKISTRVEERVLLAIEQPGLISRIQIGA